MGGGPASPLERHLLQSLIVVDGSWVISEGEAIEWFLLLLFCPALYFFWGKLEMGTYDIVDDEDDHPKRTSAWYVRTFVGVLLFAAAVTGAVVGIYMVAHPKDKKADDGGTPFTPSTPGSDPSPEDGPAPDFGPPGFAPTPIVNDNYTFGNALSLSLTFLNIQKCKCLLRIFSLAFPDNLEVTVFGLRKYYEIPHCTRQMLSMPPPTSRISCSTWFSQL